MIYIFSSLPLILIGLVGRLSLKKKINPEKANSFSLLILSFLIIIESIAFPLSNMGYYGPKLLNAVAHLLWPFFNTSNFLPPFLKLLILFLLVFHFITLVSKKVLSNKLYLILSISIISFCLINIGYFFNNYSITNRLTSKTLNINYLQDQPLSDGTIFKDKFTYDYMMNIPFSESKIRSYFFTVAGYQEGIEVTTITTKTQQEAKDVYTTKYSDVGNKNISGYVQKPINISNGEAHISILDRDGQSKSEWASGWLDNVTFSIKCNQVCSTDLSDSDFESFVMAIIENLSNN